MSKPVEPDLQSSQELFSQPPSSHDLPLQSSQSSPTSASGSPSFSPVPEISQESSLSADDSNDDDPVEKVMDSLPPPNAVTASDEEMTHVISDPDLLNSSAQCTDVEFQETQISDLSFFHSFAEKWRGRILFLVARAWETRRCDDLFF